jgi:hypothetical protein
VNKLKIRNKEANERVNIHKFGDWTHSILEEKQEFGYINID